MKGLVVLALATWRLASLLSSEDGPWGAFIKLRSLIGVRYDEHGVPYGSNQLAQGVLCLWCCSVWIGAAWAVAYWLRPDATLWVALPLALSAGAVLIDRIAGG